MIVYNTTFGIEASANKAWIEFMKTEFIPLMQTQLQEVRLCKILTSNQDGLTSYALHSVGVNEGAIIYWQTKERILLKAIRTQFGEQVLWFSTMMEEI